MSPNVENSVSFLRILEVSRHIRKESEVARWNEIKKVLRLHEVSFQWIYFLYHSVSMIRAKFVGMNTSETEWAFKTCCVMLLTRELTTLERDFEVQLKPLNVIKVNVISH